jgi:hypothetical protein
MAGRYRLFSRGLEVDGKVLKRVFAMPVPAQTPAGAPAGKVMSLLENKEPFELGVPNRKPAPIAVAAMAQSLSSDIVKQRFVEFMSSKLGLRFLACPHLKAEEMVGKDSGSAKCQSWPLLEGRGQDRWIRL